MKSIQQISSELARATETFEAAKRELQQRQATCHHEWGSIQYKPIIREAFTTAGDVPGTMGIDWQGPQFIPREETKRWQRECLKCLKEEFTTITKKEYIAGKIAGTGGQVEVPYFGR